VPTARIDDVEPRNVQKDFFLAKLLFSIPVKKIRG